MITKKYLKDLSYEITGSAIEVHRIMGRGLLESVYHQCLKEELLYRKINFLTEMKVPLIYKGKMPDADFRYDLLVEHCVVVELKAVKEMTNAFEAQLLTYMNSLKCPKGILINFNCPNIFHEGQKTFVNEHFRLSPDG